MVIEDIAKATSAVSIRKTLDFFDEKYELIRDLNKVLRAEIPINECFILNLEENGICCISSNRRIARVEISLEDSQELDEAPNTLRCLTFQGVKDKRPQVLFILGADEGTSKRFYGESFLGTKATFIYSRKAPFADLFSKSIIAHSRQSAPARQTAEARY